MIAPEKAKALRAEIKAIQKLSLAQEVYDQKIAEQRQLQELILDASVKVGEFAKEIPKAKENQYTKVPIDSVVEKQKPKADVIRDMGFSQKQVERFETLASNKDIVERVKAEARETSTMPTQTKVLEMAQIRKQMQETEMRHTEKDFENLKLFRKAVSISALCDIDDAVLDSVAAVDQDIASTIDGLQRTIEALVIIKQKLMLKGTNK